MARELIKETLFLLNIIGLNPLSDSLRSKCKAVYVTVVFIFWTGQIFLALVTGWNGTESLDSASGFVGCYMILVKIVASIIYRKKLGTILQNIDQQFWELNKYGPTFQNEAKKAYTNIKKTMFISAALYVATAVGYYIKPIFSNTRTLPIEFYYPTNLNNTFIYALTYIFQIIIILTVSFPALFGLDWLLISLIVHIVYELKMLKIGFRTVAIDTKQKGDEKQALDELDRLIDHHNLILQCVKYMRESYSMVLLNQYLNSLFIMGISLLSAISGGFPPDLPHLIRPLPYLMSNVMTLFLYCYGGTFLIIESQNVADAAYESLWWVKTQPELRRRVVLAIQRAQKMEKLTAGGMLDLNLESFTQVLRSTFSFFTLAQAVLTKTQGK